jgi:hypothetical protein
MQTRQSTPMFQKLLAALGSYPKIGISAAILVLVGCSQRLGADVYQIIEATPRTPEDRRAVWQLNKVSGEVRLCWMVEGDGVGNSDCGTWTKANSKSLDPGQ